jgi:hypothetical protein
MIIYGAGRRQGKSTAIVSWLLEDPEHRTVLVHDYQRVQHLVYMIGKIVGYNLPKKFWEDRIMVIRDLSELARFRGMHHREFAIDDVDEVLRSFLGAPITLMTATATVIKVPTPGEQGDYIDVDFEEDGWNKAELGGRRQITYEAGPTTNQRRPAIGSGN